ISSNEYDREVQSGKLREHEASQIPAEFNEMNNILEICNWLVKHPSILQLANQMYMASSSLIENVRTFNESARIWDEEIKCLFLRARFSSATCIDEFVKKIFGYPLYSKEGTEIRTKTKNTLSDFWHRLNQSVLGHV
ncbi:15532_t:CDS:2, partial [Dentiscutata erythropus]